MIKFNCPNCAKPLSARPELAGKQSKCKCGAAVTIPAPAVVLEEPAIIPAEPIVPVPVDVHFSCPGCGQKYHVPRQNVGQKVACHCGRRILVPAPPPDKTVLGKFEPAAADTSLLPGDAPNQHTTGDFPVMSGSQQQPIVVMTQAPVQARPGPEDIPDKKSAGLAIVLSFFYPGLGQMYNGHILSGLFFALVLPLLLFVLIILSITGLLENLIAKQLAQGQPGKQVVQVRLLFGPWIVIGLFLIYYVWNLFDAYYGAERINAKHRRLFRARHY